MMKTSFVNMKSLQTLAKSYPSLCTLVAKIAAKPVLNAEDKTKLFNVTKTLNTAANQNGVASVLPFAADLGSDGVARVWKAWAIQTLRAHDDAVWRKYG